MSDSVEVLSIKQDLQSIANQYKQLLSRKNTEGERVLIKNMIDQVELIIKEG